MLWQRVPTITDSDTEECFPDSFGTSWDVNFHRMSSEIVYFLSHLEKQLAINTFLPCQDTFQLGPLEVFADVVDKFPKPSIFPHRPRVVATVIGTAIVIGRYKLFLRITLFTNQFVNKDMHACFYVHVAL